MTLADTTQRAGNPPRATQTHEPTEAGDRILAAKIIVTVVLALVGWGISVATWGLPGLYLPALALVPVIWGILLLITRG